MKTLDNLSEFEINQARLDALRQACHDDKGSVPQEQTLKRAEAYFQFLVKPIGADG